MARAVATELRFPQVNSVIGNSNRNVAAIFDAIKKGANRDVLRAHDWSSLTVYYEFGFNGISDLYQLPMSFDHIINGTPWNAIDDRPANGPLTPEMWTEVVNEVVGVYPTDLNFIVGKFNFTGHGYRPGLKFYPTPVDTGSEMGFSCQFIANWHVLDGSNRLLIQKFSSDNDTSLLDTDLITQAAVVRMKRSLGLSYADDQAELLELIKDRARKDGGPPVMNAGGRRIMWPYPNTGKYVPSRPWRR